MGLSDWLRGSDDEPDDEPDEEDSEPDRWQVIGRNSQGQRAGHPDGVESGDWTYQGEPPSKQEFLFEYGAVLEGGVEYLCLISESDETGGNLNFDRISWTHEEEQTYERDTTDEISELIDRKLDDVGMPASDQPFEDRLLEAVIMGQVDLGTAKEVVSLKSDLEQAKNPTNTNFLESADISNPSQLAMGGLANMVSNYDSIGDAVEDVLGGAVRAGPAASLQDPGETGGAPAADTPAASGGTDRSQPEPEPEPTPEPDDDGGRSSAAAAHADKIAEVASGSEVQASAEVVEAAAGDDADDGADRGWTADDVPETPGEVAEELDQDFGGETVTAHEQPPDEHDEVAPDDETGADDEADGDADDAPEVDA